LKLQNQSWKLLFIISKMLFFDTIVVIVNVDVCRSRWLCARCHCTHCLSIPFLFKWYNYSSLVDGWRHLLENLLRTYQLRLCCGCLTKQHRLCQLRRGSYVADLAWWHAQSVSSTPGTVGLVCVCIVQWRHCNWCQVIFTSLHSLVFHDASLAAFCLVIKLAGLLAWWHGCAISKASDLWFTGYRFQFWQVPPNSGFLQATASVTVQCNLALAKGQWCSLAGKVTVGTGGK